MQVLLDYVILQWLEEIGWGVRVRKQIVIESVAKQFLVEIRQGFFQYPWEQFRHRY